VRARMLSARKLRPLAIEFQVIGETALASEKPNIVTLKAFVMMPWPRANSPPTQKFQSVAKGIEGVKSFVSRQGFIGGDTAPGRPQPSLQCLEIANEEGGMGLSCGPEFVFDAEMKLPLTKCEPNATEAPKLFRLFDFIHSQKAPIELPRCILALSRHCKQDMIDVAQHLSATPSPRNRQTQVFYIRASAEVSVRSASLVSRCPLARGYSRSAVSHLE
jgi:hypothetical protein